MSNQIEKITDWPFPRITDEWKRGNFNFFEITEEVFENQLNCLPPMRPEWGASYSMFFCPEEYTYTDEGAIHTVYIEIKGELPTDSRFFCKLTSIKRTNAQIFQELQIQLR